jgi:hypothetical protein
LKEEKPYNPLDKKSLGLSVAEALLLRDPVPLGVIERFNGAGIYAIYYSGDFPPYRMIAEKNKKGSFEAPIYVGKAVPAGARKGGYDLGTDPGSVLYNRLSEHAESIKQASSTIRIEDFFCRYLVVDDIWIPLGESLLISKFMPIWNQFLDGFGNHDPGKGRYNQQRSPWDVIHPGRKWAMKCAEHSRKQKEVLMDLQDFLRLSFSKKES